MQKRMLKEGKTTLRSKKDTVYKGVYMHLACRSLKNVMLHREEGRQAF
jgi:hypothetical protein